MTELNQDQALVPENADIEALQEEACTEATAANSNTASDSAIQPEPTPEQLNEAATKAAIDASGTVHLSAIYKAKVNNTHAKVANLVAKIMSEAQRVENWTHDEAMAIWDRVEAELAAA